MSEKKIFSVYGCFSVSRYIKGGKKSHLDTQLNFSTHMLYKQPTLTNEWNYNIFVQTRKWWGRRGGFFYGPD